MSAPTWKLVCIAVIAAVVVGAGFGAWGGYTLAQNHYEPKLTAANKQIGELTTANTAMKASVEHQNAAIATLQAEAKKREQAAKEAVQAARKQAEQMQTRAQAVLMLKPPAGVNQCVAAQIAFDDELRFERGVK